MGESNESLVVKIRAGDKRAAGELVAQNKGFIAHCARRYAGRCTSLDVDDLMSVGAMGLLHAVDRFEPERGFKFLTYAGNWIRQYIQRAATEDANSFGGAVGYHEIATSGRFRRDVTALRERGMAPAAIYAELAVKYKMSVEAVAALENIRPHKSLDAPLQTSDGDGATLGSLIASGARSADDLLAEKQRVQQVRDSIDRLRPKLNAREIAILDRRILGESEDVTLDDVGRDFGLSCERIRQIEVRLREKLKESLRWVDRDDTRKTRELQRLQWTLYMRKRRADHAARGLCSVCCAPAMPGGKMCGRHLTMWRDVNAGRRRARGAKSKYVFVTWRGETLYLSAWAKRLGIRQETLWARWRRWSDIDRVFTEPVRMGQRSRTHCLRGHPRTPENIYPERGKSTGKCRLCSLERLAERRRASGAVERKRAGTSPRAYRAKSVANP